MGILDRLGKITEGVVDIATAPLALPYDLIRSFPDPNYSAGDAFSTDLNRFVGGLGAVGEGTGLSTLGRTIAQHSPLDEILGKTFTELDLYYSSGLQQQMGRLPAGMGTLSNWVNSIPGVDWNPTPGDISLQRGLGTVGGAVSSALPGGVPLWEGVSRSWRESANLSPGQIFANNTYGLWNLSPEEYQQATSTMGYTLLSGALDAAARWYGQPEVLAGKGVKKLVRTRWSPDTARLLDRFFKGTGMTAEPARPMVQPIATLSDMEPAIQSTVRSQVASLWPNLDDEVKILVADAFSKDLMAEAKLVDGHLEFTPKQVRNLSEQVSSIDGLPEEVAYSILDNLPTDRMRSTISSELDSLIPEPNYGGAVNLQVAGGQGRTLLHVTYDDTLDSIQREGLLKTPPGADKIVEANETYQRIKSKLDELPSEGGAPRLPDEDLDIAFDNLINRVGALASEGDEYAAKVHETLWKLNDGEKLNPDEIEQVLWALDKADSTPLKSFLADYLRQEVGPAIRGQAGNVPIGASSAKRVGTITKDSERAIYLLDEGDMGEALRYAAALKQADPMRNPVILKINADGLPVIYEDYLNPMIPDPRSGMPSDASLMTTVDRIAPDKITEVIRPTDAELDPAAMAQVMGAAAPTYLEPGGRIHESLYNPDGSPIKPEDMLPYEDIKSTFDTAAYLYSTKGESAAIRFLKDAQATRSRASVSAANDPIEFVMNNKVTQRTLNWMDGKSADEIRRVLFPDNPTGAVMSDLLANAKTYQERRLVYQAFLGLDSPELHTISPLAEARIKALRRDLDDLKRGKEFAQRHKDLEHASIEGSDYSNQVWMDDEEYNALEAMIRGEIAEAQSTERVGRFLEAIQKQAPIVGPQRVSRYVLGRERFRSSSWYQDSPLARPIRSVVEKRPHQFVNIHDPNADIQIVRQLEEARPLGVRADRVRFYREAYMHASTETDRIRILNKMDNEIIEAAAKRAGLSKDEITVLVNKAHSGKTRTSEFLASRKYSSNDADVHTYYDADTGEMVQLTLPLMETQLQNWVPITDVRSVISASTAIRRVRRRLGSVPKELMDSFYHLWKPSVLLRGGWPIRVVSDEQLRILARTGSLLRHMAAIDAGELPRWSNIFAEGMSLPSRAAAAVGTVTTAPLSASTRINRWLVRGAEKLRLLDSQWLEDMKAIGYDQLASSRAAFAGPTEAMNTEFQALIGHHEIGILDHLRAKGTGQWTSYSKTDRNYGTAWTRVLRDQIGRDPLARRILEAFVNAPDRMLSRREAISRSLRAWIDETGLTGFGDLNEWSRYVSDAYESGAIVRGASPQDWLDNVLRPFADYHRLEIDDIIEDLSLEWASKMDGWSDGIYDAWQTAGTHAGMRRDIEEGLLRILGEVDEAVVDDVVHAFDVFKFGSVGKVQVDYYGTNNFEDWFPIYAERSPYLNMEPGQIDEVLDQINNWVPENPRVSFELQDPMSGLKQWLTNTTEGIEYGKKLPWNYSNVDRWLEGLSGMISDYTDEFNPRVVEDILGGKISSSTLEAIPDSRRPAAIHGEIVDQFLGNSVITRALNDFTSTAFDTFGRLPTDVLSRQPFFKHMYANEMQRIRGVMERQGIEMTEEAIQQASTRSRNYALHEVNKWLYNLAETSRFGEMMRFMTPFYAAWQEVLEVWMGLARRDPSIIGRARLLWQAPNKAGMVTTDDEGNEFITFRLSEKMADKLPQTDWLQYMAEGGIRFGKTSFNLILNSPLPGAGPPIQIAANEIVKNKPNLEETLKFLLPYGVKQNALEVLASPLVRRLNSEIGGLDGDKTYERDFTNIMVWMDWQYRMGERTSPPTYQEVEDAAKKIFAIRTFSTISMPAQPIFDSPLKMYQDIYRQLIEDYGTDQADEIFLNEYGNEYFAVTMSRTVSQTGLPPTVDAWEAGQRLDDLISKYPEFGRLIVGEDSATGEFSSAVFAYQLTHPVGDSPYAEPDRQYRELTLDPETGTIEEVDRRLGWTEYITAMDQLDLIRRSRGLPNLRVKDAQDLALMKQAITTKIAQEYPAWWRAFNERDDLKWDKTIEALSAIAFDPAMEDRSDLAGVVDYMTARQGILGELNRRKQLGGSSTLTATDNQDLATVWEAIVNSIIEDNVEFGPIYYRYLEGDPVNLKVTTP